MRGEAEKFRGFYTTVTSDDREESSSRRDSAEAMWNHLQDGRERSSLQRIHTHLDIIEFLFFIVYLLGILQLPLA